MLPSGDSVQTCKEMKQSKHIQINWGVQLVWLLNPCQQPFLIRASVVVFCVYNDYSFEFENRTPTVSRVCSIPDKEAWSVRIWNNPLQTKKSLLVDLFGVEEVAAASLYRIRLPRTPLIELKEKQLESLASKNFSIPVDKLWYYPDTYSITTNTTDQEENIESPDDITVQQ